MAIPVSAVVLTKNEARNLRSCLASLAWADELLVVDSLSTDATPAIAQQNSARVILHPFANYAAQRNFAQTQAQHDWILFVDADERVSAELRDEISGLAQSGALAENTAYHIQRLHLISGEWFHSQPGRKVTARLRASIRRNETPRLVDRRQTTWKRPLHEIADAPEPHGVLEGVIYHYASTNLSLMLEDFNAYSDLEAARLQRLGQRVSLLEAFARSARNFLFMYFGQGLYRRGEVGLLVALHSGFMKFTNYAKLWERQRILNGKGVWTEADQELLRRFDHRLDTDRP